MYRFFAHFALRSGIVRSPACKRRLSGSPPQLAYHEEVSVVIAELSAEGLGIGHLPWEGGAIRVTVPLTLVGESVVARVFRCRDGHADADLVSVQTASPHRVEPRCVHYSECSGCQFQHISVSAQRVWKRELVGRLLAECGLDSSVNPVVGDSQTYAYRTKLSPHYDRPRSAAPMSIGFRRRGRQSIVDVLDCAIAPSPINEALGAARARIVAAAATARPTNGATLLFRLGEEGVETDFRATVTERVGNLRFRFTAGEFFQTNAGVLPLLVQHVMRMADGHGCTALVDAYSGSGLFAISAAHRFGSVCGVEVSYLAVRAARMNASLNDVHNVSFVEASSEAIFAQLSAADFPPAATVVVIDPPRKGCDSVFLDQLFAFMPRKIVYVSCEPRTQARDAKLIVSAGYRVLDCSPFDMFPQTRHVENVMTFIR
jgi:23S rRNA (uracil1939-C5)-methyltransferase/tRNA (uracil-5-)-methyltransferase